MIAIGCSNSEILIYNIKTDFIVNRLRADPYHAYNNLEIWNLKTQDTFNYMRDPIAIFSYRNVETGHCGSAIINLQDGTQAIGYEEASKEQNCNVQHIIQDVRVQSENLLYFFVGDDYL